MMSELNKRYAWKEEYNYRWEKSPELSNFPNDAVYAGYDGDRSNIYVGRAYHEGYLLPAKVVTKQDFIYVSVPHDNEEHQKTEFEVLCGPPVAWQKNGKCSSYGSAPCKDFYKFTLSAIPIGEAKSGEKLFMGRSFHYGTLTPGVIDLEKNCLLLPSHEYVTDDFEVMVYPLYP